MNPLYNGTLLDLRRNRTRVLFLWLAANLG